MKHSVFDPYNAGKYNKSLDNLIQAIEDNGYQVHPIKDVLSYSALARKIEIVHLNWFEDLRGNSQLSILYCFLKKACILLFLKWRGKKIVWSMHNRQSHDTKNAFLSQLLYTWLVKQSYRIMIYSNQTRNILLSQYTYAGLDQKIVRVPHPHFIGSYGPIQANRVSKKLQLLFLGQIRAYKNIELLIDVFSTIDEQDAELTIVGDASLSYQQELIQRASGKENIHFQFGFVADKDIPNHLAVCDLMVLPLDIASSLNSGTAILAFSYNKTIICPFIGTTSDIVNSENMILYNYTTREEHILQLGLCIKQAIEKKHSDGDIFIRLGQNMQQEMLQNNTMEKVQSALYELYN